MNITNQLYICASILLLFMAQQTHQRRGGGGRGRGGGRRGGSRGSSGGSRARYGSFSRGTAKSGYSGMSPGRQRFAAFAGGAVVGYLVIGGSMRRRYFYNSRSSTRTDYGDGICSALVDESLLQNSTDPAVTSTATVNPNLDTFHNSTTEFNSTQVRIYWDCEPHENCAEAKYDCTEAPTNFYILLYIAMALGAVAALYGVLWVIDRIKQRRAAEDKEHEMNERPPSPFPSAPYPSTYT